ncbi:molybdate ABC transporter substrate-binding protein [Thalassorhabdomicrobium marinisediminis]|uniref:molybdate ABC transporter substrate-binding protein n=1 Tax=Thalassorhabdomicrobium marinisediminis TaxID=2170577 RepID=UPI0024939B46|nr:molybdate ABC transporter substrate-binding protein [Thalassorhabdomicrobium marinisediminis]
MKRLAGSAGRILAICGALWTLAGTPGAAEPVTIFAAASLRDAVGDVTAAFEAETGQDTTLVFAASSAIARQAAAGAPADVMLLADVDWADWLVEQGVLETVIPVAGNALVVVGRAPGQLESAQDLPDALGDGVLAVAQVDAVPAGRYAKAALTSLGLWDALAPRAVQADNVRAALRFVERGEAALGIGYASDLVALPDLHEIYRFAAETHPPIIYAGGAITPAGAPFMAYLVEPAAQDILSDWGFLPVGATP